MRLGRPDLKAILEFLARIDEVPSDEPYGDEVLDAFRTLVPTDEVGYQEVDLAARRFVVVTPPEPDEEYDLYWAVGPCPITEYRARTADISAVRMSDVIGRTRYHELPIYREYFQPVGLDHVLDLGLATVRSGYRSVVFLRGHDAPDFSERDRAILETLRPHLRAREARSALVAAVAGRMSDSAEPLSGVDEHLTTREREILAMVAEGKTNAQIAADLWVSPATVKKHLENVYQKLGVGSRAAAASRAQAESRGYSIAQ